MKVSIFGLGYVGAVSAACLADRGHPIVGVDPNRTKVDMLARGESPIVEPGLPELIIRVVKKGALTADAPTKAVMDTDISIVCVGTPSQKSGSLDFTYLENVCGEIGAVLAKKGTFHVVVIRSTVLPGTMRELVIPMLEKKSGKTAGADFGVCNNPEFLREGTAIMISTILPKPSSAKRTNVRVTWCNRFMPGCRGRSSAARLKSPRWSNTPTTPGTRPRWPSPTRSANSARRRISTAIR